MNIIIFKIVYEFNYNSSCKHNPFISVTVHCKNHIFEISHFEPNNQEQSIRKNNQ